MVDIPANYVKFPWGYVAAQLPSHPQKPRIGLVHLQPIWIVGSLNCCHLRRSQNWGVTSPTFCNDGYVMLRYLEVIKLSRSESTGTYFHLNTFFLWPKEGGVLARNARFKKGIPDRFHCILSPSLAFARCGPYNALHSWQSSWCVKGIALEFPVEFSFEQISGVALIVAIPTCICMWIILVSPEMQSFVQNCVILSSKIFCSSTSGKQRCPTVHQSYRCLKINRRWSLMKMTGEKRCTAEKSYLMFVWFVCTRLLFVDWNFTRIEV